MDKINAPEGFWYPVMPAEALKPGEVCEQRLFGLPVAVFRDAQGQLHALEDACVHRSAKLSRGQVVRGQLRCPYHGWRYDGAGRCQLIPSLAKDREIPAGARIRAFPVTESGGLIWLWPGAPEKVTDSPEMAIDEQNYFAGKEWDRTLYCRDIDIRHSLLIENLLDPAHIHFVHAGTMSQPENAGPVEPALVLTERGFHAEGLRRPGVHSAFTGPVLVTLYFNFGFQRSVQFFYCVPLTATSMRLINPIYTLAGTRRPESLIAGVEHVLGEDLVVLEQVEQRLREGYPQCRIPVPADRALLEYQRWLKRHSP